MIWSHDRHYAAQMADDNSKESMDSMDDKKYSDKEQLTALLLTTFLGSLGAGRFYVGDDVRGCGKLVFSLIVCAMLCFSGRAIFKLVKSGDSDDSSVEEVDENDRAWIICRVICDGIVICLWLFGIFGDIALFALNEVKDENGLTLLPL